jgi:hypothetical protein
VPAIDLVTLQRAQEFNRRRQLLAADRAAIYLSYLGVLEFNKKMRQGQGRSADGTWTRGAILL